MELKSKTIRRHQAGNGHKHATLIRLIYILEESRRPWIVELPWFSATSEPYRVRAENRACQNFRRIYGHDLAPERIARMWKDFKDFWNEVANGGNHD